MAITFDGPNRRIILGSSTVTAEEVWSRWVDWLEEDPENQKWPLAFSQVGGDDLGAGLFIPIYLFLQSGWRVRPMEANHLLVITGNLFVQGGGQPVVQTLGTYNVSVQYTVPVQAQAFAASGGASVTPTQIWDHALDGGYTAAMCMKLFGAVLGGKTSIVDNGDGTATVTFRNLADNVDASVFQVAGSERTARVDNL